MIKRRETVMGGIVSLATAFLSGAGQWLLDIGRRETPKRSLSLPSWPRAVFLIFGCTSALGEVLLQWDDKGRSRLHCFG